MTTRAPEPAGYLTVSSLPSVYTLGSGEGCCAPLRTPGLSRRCGAPDGRRRRPRTPYRCALGGSARRCGNPRPAADPAAFGLARPGRFVH